jgi:DNA repair protein RecN (Recombination protein N)
VLTTLRIKNLALVVDLTLELRPGYNVITGETGAGKSILIGALNLVLGERADRALIRNGSDSCSVEAVFEISRLKAVLKGFLEENGLEPCEDDQLVLKRAFTSNGVNRQFINGSPTTLNVLAQLGEWLVDIHGPHEHQSLLHPARQLAILDAYGGLDAEREAFSQLVRRRAAIEAEKAALIMDERTYAQQLDLLRFQTSEIAAARLDPAEEEQVAQDHQRAANSARLLQLVQSALDALSESENSLLANAGSVGRTLHELHRVDSSAARLVELHEQSLSALKDLQTELSRYADRVELDPARLQQLEERLNVIQSLKRKYGATVAQVLAFGQEAGQKLEGLEQRETELARLNNELAKVDAELSRSGQVLSVRRRKLLPQLGKDVAKQLSDLGFKQSRFEVTLTSSQDAQAGRAKLPLSRGSVDSAQPGSPGGSPYQGAASDNSAAAPPDHGLRLTGFDTIEFQFAPNPGEPPRPLRTIASSGELARVMLALKTVLAAEDRIPVLVFDEVDANVGGETAHTVGSKMQQIARQRQVLCITHLPQVAAPAAAHFLALKQVKAGRTISEITLLGGPERVTELARMLGGQTDAARQHAQALLQAVE